jgi:hypothetical protein
MVNKINTYNISNIYRNCPSSGDDRRRHPEQEGVSPALPVDRVSLSRQALQERAGKQHAPPGLDGERELNEDQKQQVRELKKRDAEVKSHEQAHMASGGGLVQGGASFEYQSGPDGRMYAVGGEVKIDMSAERTPEATIRKMQQVRRAALAPAEPSGTDRAVAAQAAQIEAQARMERSQENAESAQPGNDTAAPPYGPAGAAHEPDRGGSDALRQARGRRIDLVI